MTTDRNLEPRRAGTFLNVLAALAILGCGIGIAVALIKNQPRAQRRPPDRQARLVEVTSVQRTNAQAVVRAMGTVGPSREVRLTPRISGQILEVSPRFIPGGRFAEGEPMLRLDPTDFEIALREREAEWARVRADLAMEQGQQSIARREFDLLGEEIAEGDRGLVLRQPQLDKVKAAVAAAEAAVERARLDLARCTVTAPFNSVVRDRQVNLGMQVGTGTALATLAGTDAYWVEVLVSVSDLRWLSFPDESGDGGSPARLVNPHTRGPGQERRGRVLRLLSDLEAEGRMARVLVEVQDPLAVDSDPHAGPPLLLGEFVEVLIEGRPLPDVAAIDRAWVHDGNQVWLMNPHGQLEIRPVEILFRGHSYYLIRDGLGEGDRLITSDLPAAVEGMPVRTLDSAPEEARPS